MPAFNHPATAIVMIVTYASKNLAHGLSWRLQDRTYLAPCTAFFKVRAAVADPAESTEKNMIDHTAVLLVVTVGAVGVLHTLVPDHWAPIVILARQRGRRTDSAISVLSGPRSRDDDAVAR